MASANLDLVQSVYAVWERGDWSSTEWADPEIEFVIPDGPAPGAWIGLAGLAKGGGAFLSSWEEYRLQVEEYRELDSERVLVLHNVSGHGKTSGLELAQMGSQTANLFHLQGGKVTRLVAYFDRERALADVGLAPKTGSAHP